MSELDGCPRCAMQNTYPDGNLLICADCGHEWVPGEAPASNEPEARIIKDAHGTPLADGDTVVLIKDLRVKGSSTTLKGGTRIKNIRLVDGDHEIDCKIEGTPYMLKAMYMKKA